VRTDPRFAATTDRSAGTPVTSIRVLYPDLHGVARGKDVPIAEFDYVLESGLRFCAAVMGTDLRQTPVVGGEQGYPDLVARPDMTTMAPMPWEPGVASCLADLEPAEGGAPIPDPRGTLRRVVEDLRAIGLDPIVAPELESSCSGATGPQHTGSGATSTDRAWSTRLGRRRTRAASCGR
jgi:glutamine synthetase